MAFADLHEIHRAKEHNKRNKPILTQKQRNVGNVSVKREIQSAAQSYEKKKKKGDPTTTKIMTAPNCRDAVGFSGGECHVVTSPNHPPWRENTAYWPRVRDDVIIPPKSYKSTCTLIPRYTNRLDSGKNTSRLVFR